MGVLIERSASVRVLTSIAAVLSRGDIVIAWFGLFLFSAGAYVINLCLRRHSVAIGTAAAAVAIWNLYRLTLLSRIIRDVQLDILPWYAMVAWALAIWILVVAPYATRLIHEQRYWEVAGYAIACFVAGSVYLLYWFIPVVREVILRYRLSGIGLI